MEVYPNQFGYEQVSRHVVMTWWNEIMKTKVGHRINLIAKIGGALVVSVGVIAGIVAIIQFFESRPAVDLTGEWKLINTVESTSYLPYQGMQLGYRIFLQQNGTKITGKGEKWWENGKEIPSTAHSPIFIEGILDGMTLTATFVEKGARRTTSGFFVWTVSPDRRMLQGRFTHTAANSRGNSIGQRIK